nr:hypothetical protein [Providencia sp. PROV019]
MGWNLKNRLPAKPMNQKEQRYRLGRQRLTHKLANVNFWRCRKENQTRARPEQNYWLKPLKPRMPANALLIGCRSAA